MNKTFKRILTILAVAVMLFAICAPAFAADINEAEVLAATAVETEETNADNSTSAKAISAAIIISLATAAGAIAMAIAIKASADGMAKQPEVLGPIRSSMMLGLVFIETAIIYALIVAILVIFVL